MRFGKKVFKAFDNKTSTWFCPNISWRATMKNVSLANRISSCGVRRISFFSCCMRRENKFHECFWIAQRDRTEIREGDRHDNSFGRDKLCTRLNSIPSGILSFLRFVEQRPCGSHRNCIFDWNVQLDPSYHLKNIDISFSTNLIFLLGYRDRVFHQLSIKNMIIIIVLCLWRRRQRLPDCFDHHSNGSRAKPRKHLEPITFSRVGIYHVNQFN